MQNAGVIFYSTRKIKLLFISMSLFAGLIANAQSTYPTIDQFTAYRAGDAVVLNWTISPGMTCPSIFVMHSTDSINFSPIYEYLGVCGPNAHSETHSFTHESPSSMKNYYRMDVGSEKGATIIPVHMILYGADGFTVTTNETGRSGIHFYNPAHTLYTLEVYSLDGKVCYHDEKINGDNALLPNLSEEGILIFRLTGEDGTVYTGKYFNISR
jgi:hypothetical protein